MVVLVLEPAVLARMDKLSRQGLLRELAARPRLARSWEALRGDSGRWAEGHRGEAGDWALPCI